MCASNSQRDNVQIHKCILLDTTIRCVSSNGLGIFEGRQSRTGGLASLGIFDSGCRLQPKDIRLIEPSATKGDS